MYKLYYNVLVYLRPRLVGRQDYLFQRVIFISPVQALDTPLVQGSNV